MSGTPDQKRISAKQLTRPRVDALPREQWCAFFEELSAGTLPELLGMSVAEVEPGRAVLLQQLRSELLLRNGYVHAGTVVALADTAAGYGCLASLPEHAVGFTTMELKTNLIATATAADDLRCEARLVHPGRTTQVWDAEVTRVRDGRALALFRCTQILLDRPRLPAPESELERRQ